MRRASWPTPWSRASRSRVPPDRPRRPPARAGLRPASPPGRSVRGRRRLQGGSTATAVPALRAAGRGTGLGPGPDRAGRVGPRPGRLRGGGRSAALRSPAPAPPRRPGVPAESRRRPGRRRRCLRGAPRPSRARGRSARTGQGCDPLPRLRRRQRPDPAAGDRPRSGRPLRGAAGRPGHRDRRRTAAGGGTTRPCIPRRSAAAAGRGVEEPHRPDPRRASRTGPAAPGTGVGRTRAARDGRGGPGGPGQRLPVRQRRPDRHRARH